MRLRGRLASGSVDRRAEARAATVGFGGRGGGFRRVSTPTACAFEPEPRDEFYLCGNPLSPVFKAW